MKFENNMLEQQLNETRVRKQIEISEIDGQLQDQYDERLKNSLQELRDAYEVQMGENKVGFTAVYDKKIADLNAKVGEERAAASAALQETKKIADLNAKVGEERA